MPKYYAAPSSYHTPPSNPSTRTQQQPGSSLSNPTTGVVVGPPALIVHMARNHARVRTVRRGPPAELGQENKPKSESKTSPSDLSTKGGHLKVGTTLQPKTTSRPAVSLVAKSPAREAQASQPSPVVAPSPLGATPVSRPQEPPTGVPTVFEPPTPRFPDSESRVADPPPNLADPPKTHEPSLPVLERASEQPGPVPFVIQMINSGKDVDTIIRSVLGDDVQISIDAIDRVCSTFARRHETRKLTAVFTRSVD